MMKQSFSSEMERSGISCAVIANPYLRWSPSSRLRIGRQTADERNALHAFLRPTENPGFAPYQCPHGWAAIALMNHTNATACTQTATSGALAEVTSMPHETYRSSRKVAGLCAGPQ
jgi:hypothetical protein